MSLGEHKLRGWNIHYSRYDDKWKAINNDKVTFTSQSLKSLKQRCDGFEKKKVNVFVIISTYDDTEKRYKDVIVKGKANVKKYEDKEGSENVWVVYDEPVERFRWSGKHTKECHRRSEVFLDSGENLERVKEWNEARKELKEVEKKGRVIVGEAQKKVRETEEPYKTRVERLKKQILPLNWVEKVVDGL